MIQFSGSSYLLCVVAFIFFLFMFFPDFEIPSDTKAALLFLKSVIPLSKFEGKIPAIILKHQLYCVVKDKTLVDRQLVSILLRSGYYKYFLGRGRGGGMW